MQEIGILTVNLSAISQNWLMMRRSLKPGTRCAAVVKANAYGLGVARVAQALYAAGCRVFFVARLGEGIELRRIIPNEIPVYVLQGVLAGEEPQFRHHQLTPVLISLPMVRRWQRFAQANGHLACAIKINTGMNRLGLSMEEFAELMAEPNLDATLNLELVVSHLACADDPGHPLNALQLERFQAALRAARGPFPNVKASLANSAGVFLGTDWQQDVVRPGIALYGGCPRLDRSVRPAPVVSVKVRVIQTRDLVAGEAIGYGADFKASRNMRVCIAASGYAEGMLRSLNSGFHGWFHRPLPLLGRVSMDSMVFDSSHLNDAQQPKEGDEIEILGEHVSLDEFAASAGTSSYEVLTRLGGRLQLRYLEPGL